jgi:hypothetical protein
MKSKGMIGAALLLGGCGTGQARQPIMVGGIWVDVRLRGMGRFLRRGLDGPQWGQT